MPITAWIALGLSVVAGAVSYAFLSATLGLFFAGIVFTALLTPPLCLAEQRLADRLIIAAAVIDGIAGVWFIAAIAGPPSVWQWLFCYAALIAWGLALAGTSVLLAQMLDAMPAAALTILLAIVWLTCPIWLRMHAAVVVPVHPLFALNGILADFGFWTERPIAYRYLFNLGQDAPYELPRSILPTAMLHLALGLAALLLSRKWGKGRS